MTSLFPLKVNPVSQVTVYLLPEAIVAEVGATVPSEIVGLLQELAENTVLSNIFEVVSLKEHHGAAFCNEQ